jgi:hypothetical protein
MALDADFWARINAEQAERELRARLRFEATGAAIPDLDMWPSCSICNGNLEFDDVFHCPGCRITWQRDGTEPQREDD